MSRFSLTPATVTTLLIVCPALAGILLSLGGWELGGQLWLSFAAQMVVLVLVLAIPTVGSLLGAWLLGFRFVLWIVGPLRLARPANRLILGRNDSWQAYGGTVLCVPTRFSPDVARRLAYYTAAGPLLGLLIGIVCTLLLVSPGPAGAADAFPASYLHVVLLVLGPGLLLLILVWGLRAAALITTYLKSGPATDRRIACLALTAQSSAGQRPREWSAPWIDQALSLPDRSLPDVSAHLLAYYHALDGGAVEAAGAHLDYAVAASGALPTLYRPGIYTEAAYFIARYRNDPATARALLDKSGGHTVTPADRCRAEAAVLLGEGRRAEAAVRAGEGLTLLGRDWNAGTAQAERDWLQEIVSVTSADGPAARAPLVARPARWPWPALLIGSVGVAGLAVAGGLLFPGVQAKAVASLPFQGQCVAATDSGTVQPRSLRVGDLAPDFTVDGVAGDEITLSQYRGRQPVWLDFWQAGCVYCLQEMADIQPIAQTYADKGIAVIGVNVGDAPQQVQQFIRAKGYTWHFGIDRAGVVADQYCSTAVPTDLFINRDGVIQAILVGRAGRTQLRMALDSLLRP